LYATNDFGLTVFSTDATGTMVSTPDVDDLEVCGYEGTPIDSMIFSAVSTRFPLLGPKESTGRRRGGVGASPLALAGVIESIEGLDSHGTCGDETPDSGGGVEGRHLVSVPWSEGKSGFDGSGGWRGTSRTVRDRGRIAVPVTTREVWARMVA